MAVPGAFNNDDTALNWDWYPEYVNEWCENNPNQPFVHSELIPQGPLQTDGAFERARRQVNGNG